MKSFFQNMNFARGLILVSAVGTPAIGIYCWQMRGEVAELREALETKMVPTVQTLMQSAQRHTELEKLKKGESLVGSGETDMNTYIRRVGAKDHVEIGELNVTSQETALTSGIVDKRFTIKPDSPTASFDRLRIVNFLYSLEDESRRVRLTRVKLEVADQKGLKPHEIPKDLWRFDCELTSRQRK